MRLQNQKTIRRGAIIPMVAICLVAILGLVALAIDIGMVAVAKTQAQNAADAAAMAGTRTFNQQSGYNLTSVPKNAIMAAVANRIHSATIKGDPNSVVSPSTDVYTSGDVKIECGGYYYIYNDSNPAAEKFDIVIPGKSASEPYTAVRATITSTSPLFFGNVFGASPLNVKATAVAAHRPRDVVIIMDLSGSMNFQSRSGCYVSGGFYYPHWGPRNMSLNPESIFPQYGHYSDINAAALQGKSDGSTGAEAVTRSNVSADYGPAGPAAIANFMTSGSTPAFSRALDSYATTPGGDNFLKLSGAYVKTLDEYFGGSADATETSTWERGTGTPPVSSTAGYGASFAGYTQGPGYWGKTFFIWPPDPRGSDLDANTSTNHANNGAKDWRQRFFFKKNTSTNLLYWLDQNRILFDSAGAPATSNGSGVTPILKNPNTTTSVVENGVSVSYRLCINYAAIFHWLRNQSPAVFPASMTTGRINYYSAIPDPTGDSGFNNRFWTQSPMTNLNERFWKDYIDFMLGFHETGANSYSNTNGTNPWSSYIGNGDLYQWGTVQVNQDKPDNTHKGTINNTGGYAAGATSVKFNTVQTVAGSNFTLTKGTTYYLRFGYGSTIYKFTAPAVSSGSYTVTLDIPLTTAVANTSLVKIYTAVPRSMNYADNPYRPRHQYWFGAMTFVDWLGNYSVYHDGTNYTLRWPGNTHEAQAWSCKVGISAAIDDIKNNHPNDFVGLTFFSNPSYSTSGGGHHNMAVIPLGRNYQGMKDSLWFPPSTVSGGVSTITPYDADFNNVPRAKGGTCPGMGLMIAYNLMSPSTANLRNFAAPSSTYRGYAGGLGRKGASRLVIFETDGAPNTRAIATLAGSGSESYYPIRIKSPSNIGDAQNEFPAGGSYSDSEVYDVVKQICAMDNASPPGYSTTRKPAKVYSLGFGSLFEPTNTSTAQTDALDFLQNVQYYGNVSSSTSGSSFPDWQRIYGDNATRQQRLRDAFTTIMQSGVQVSLIE